MSALLAVQYVNSYQQTGSRNFDPRQTCRSELADADMLNDSFLLDIAFANSVDPDQLASKEAN